MILIGAGEHGRVIIDAARSRPEAVELVGFVDPQPCEATVSRFGLPRLGGEEALADHPGLPGIIGVGAVGISTVRAEVDARLSPRLAGWGRVVHASATVSTSAVVGDGAAVLAGAVVGTGARLGRHVIVNTGAIVEHDVVLGDFVQLSPGAILGGGVRVGPGAYIGLGAQIRDHVTIGANALVAMGAVVVSDVPDGARVRGVPAR